MFVYEYINQSIFSKFNKGLDTLARSIYKKMHSYYNFAAIFFDCRKMLLDTTT